MQNASVTLLCFTSRFSSVFVLLLNIFKVIFYKKPGQKKSPLCFSVWSSVTPVFEEPNPSLCRTASKNLQFTWFLMCWWSNNLLLVCMYYCWMSAYDKTCRSGCIMNWVGFFLSSGKLSIIISPLLKPGKAPTLPLGYCPVSLTNESRVHDKCVTVLKKGGANVGQTSL